MLKLSLENMLNEIRNNIDFFIRNLTKFSRKNFVEINPENIERNGQENLYTYDILEKYLTKTPQKNISALDIGSKNWFYAKGEHRFFKSFSKNFELDGIELDAYRLYCNFYSRYEVAKFHIKDLENTTYIADNLLNLNKQYDYIIWILPFVVKDPLIAWGLPRRFFCPEKLLSHAYRLLNKNGQLLIINQGEKEANVQKELLDKLNISYKELGEIKSEHFEYQNKRYGFLISKI